MTIYKRLLHRLSIKIFACSQDVKQRTGFIVGPVCFSVTCMKYGVNRASRISVFVKCAAKELKIRNSCELLSTVKIIWKITKGWPAAQRKNGVTRQNEQVKKNRAILLRLIDAVCYLAHQELPFLDNEESSTSLNKGNCVKDLSVLNIMAHFLKIIWFQLLHFKYKLIVYFMKFATPKFKYSKIKICIFIYLCHWVLYIIVLLRN